MQNPGMRRWLEEFVARDSRSENVDSWVEQVQSPVLKASPRVAGDAALTHTVRTTIRAHWLSFLVSLLEPERPHGLVESGKELAADLVLRGYDLTDLIGLYRAAERAVWDYLTQVVTASETDVDKTALLVFLWGRASSWLDLSVDESTRVFQTEVDRIAQGTAAKQLDAVHSVLAGHDPGPRELATTFGGYPMAGFNTAALLYTDDYTRVAQLHEAVGRLTDALRTKYPLIVRPGGRHLWCWFATASPPAPEALYEAGAWLTEQGIRVSVGTPARGPDGFRLSHQEAQQAQKLQFATAEAGSLCLYGDVKLVSLLAASGEGARRFTLRTLGRLAELGEGNDRLRQTLHAFLTSRSVERAAQTLLVHKNTVRYRIGQAEELLGRPLDTSAADVEVALRYHAMFLRGAG